MAASMAGADLRGANIQVWMKLVMFLLHWFEVDYARLAAASMP